MTVAPHQPPGPIRPTARMRVSPYNDRSFALPLPCLSPLLPPSLSPSPQLTTYLSPSHSNYLVIAGLHRLGSLFQEPGTVYGGEVGPSAAPTGSFGQPLTVDTACSSPGIRHPNSMVPPTPNQHGTIYSQGQGPVPPQYHPHNLPVSLHYLSVAPLLSAALLSLLPDTTIYVCRMHILDLHNPKIQEIRT